MSRATVGSASWKSSTTTAKPSGRRRASLAMAATTSGMTTRLAASRSAAVTPKAGTTTRIDWTNPAQNRRESASDSSHESQEVRLGSLRCAQLDNRTLLPAPAEPTTTVNRSEDPADTRSHSDERGTNVDGRVVGRNLASANWTSWADAGTTGGAPRSTDSDRFSRAS